MKKLLTFFQKNIKVHVNAIFNDQSFNNTLINNIFSLKNLALFVKDQQKYLDKFINIYFISNI